MTHDTDVAALLVLGAQDIDVATAPVDVLVRAGRQSIRRRRALGAAGASAAAVAVVLGVSLTDGPQQGPAAAPASSTTGGSVAGCSEPVRAAVLPPWARGGFSDSRPRMPYVAGEHGDIVGILFGQPLTAPPAADHGNKILWVSRLTQEPSTDLRIDARLLGGSSTVERTVPGGPGPSIIDLPEPGCWHLTLSWSGHSDSLEVAYLPLDEASAG
jgi:hypothetical protein